MNLDAYITEAKKKEKENLKVAKKLKQKRPKNLDQIFASLTRETYNEIDCLECGNCCRTLGPRIRNIDITRLSSHLQIKPTRFVNTYLKVDEDQDYVMKKLPCPFILPDNYCTVYQFRPKACKDFPQTELNRMHQILKIIVKNTTFCPIAFTVFEKIKTNYSDILH